MVLGFHEESFLVEALWFKVQCCCQVCIKLLKHNYKKLSYFKNLPPALQTFFIFKHKPRTHFA